MPIGRLLLILFCVIAAAAITIWAATTIFGGLAVSPTGSLTVLTVVAMVVYVVLRQAVQRDHGKVRQSNDRVGR